jgi:nitrile hydratase alpha subunit
MSPLRARTGGLGLDRVAARTPTIRLWRPRAGLFFEAVMNAEKFNRNEFDAKLVAKALKDPDFRARLLSNPEAIYAAELGREIPSEAKIVVLEERGDTFYVVIPFLPEALKAGDGVIDAVSRRELTYRHPCWGLGDGPETGLSCSR